MAAPLGFENTQDPRKIAANNRGLIQQRSDQLNQENQDLADQATQQARGYQGFLDPIEQQLARGEGGYTAEEAAAIQGNTGPHALDTLPTSRDELQGNFLTGDEQGAMRGDTGSYGDFFDPGHLHDSLAADQGVQQGAVGDLRRDLGNAIRPNDLRQSGTYADAMHEQVNANQGAVRGALGSTTERVRGAIDPVALKQSEAAARNEVMTPEEEQRQVVGAGISAGVRNDAAVGALQRQALAAGSSPLGVAAYRARMYQASAEEAGDAMTKARIGAQQARAGEALSSEDQRLKAQAGLTGTQTSAELDLGKQGVASEEHLGDQALQQANTQEANRQAAEQYLTGAEMQAATTGGEAELQNAQTQTQQEQNQNQFVTTSGTALRQAQDVADTGRATAIATNRQQTGEGNQATGFNQGMTVNNAGSGRATTVANTRLGKQDTGLALQSGQEQQQNANAQGAYGRQQQGFATQTGGINDAAKTAEAASQNPTGADKIIGGVTGGLSAAAKFLDEGGIATEPTLAVLGEHGPEKVVPMGNPYRARSARMMHPPQRKRTGRRVYGEVA